MYSEGHRAFLTNAIKSPGVSYDEQLELLRSLEELTPDHLLILKAMSQEPELDSDPRMMVSPTQTLKERLSEFTERRIDELVSQLYDMRITRLASLRKLVTGPPAADLRPFISDYGNRILNYIIEV